MNRLSDESGASSANCVPSVVLTKWKSSKSTTNDDVSVFVSRFREVIAETSKESMNAAERRHREAQDAEDKRVVMKTTAADNRVVLQAQLENKSYLKRRIDNLQDEARKIRFKIFESKESNRPNDESFFHAERELLEKEITKCNNELEDN